MQNNKIEEILRFYLLCSKLKDVIRTGWKDWSISKERLESVAEHIYGTCMLAIAIDSEYPSDIDISKVITMLAIHELEETLIGDITPFDNITPKEKLEKGHNAIASLFAGLFKGADYVNIIKEFDAKETAEAKFAYFIDKLECDLQAKLYDDSGYCDISNAPIKILSNERINQILHSDAIRVSEVFFHYDRPKYDGTMFQDILDYAMKCDFKNLSEV